MSQSSKTSFSDSEEEKGHQMLTRERQRLHDLLEEVGRMSFDTHSLIKANEDLKIKVLNLEQAAFERNKLAQDKEEEFKKLVDMNMTLEEDNSILEKTNTAMENKNMVYDKEIAELMQKFRALEEKNTTLEEENSALEQVNYLLETYNTVHVQENADLKQQSQALERKNTTLEEKNTDLEDKITALKKENSVYEQVEAGHQWYLQVIYVIGPESRSSPRIQRSLTYQVSRSKRDLVDRSGRLTLDESLIYDNEGDQVKNGTNMKSLRLEAGPSATFNAHVGSSVGGGVAAITLLVLALLASCFLFRRCRRSAKKATKTPKAYEEYPLNTKVEVCMDKCVEKNFGTKHCTVRNVNINRNQEPNGKVKQVNLEVKIHNNLGDGTEV